MIFETHAHYDDDAFCEDREQLLEKLPKEGIGRVANIAASIPSCHTTMALSDKYPCVYEVLGVHPSDTGALTEADFEWLRGQVLARSLHCGGKCLAVGEIGLDYYWEEPSHEIQKKWFLRQLSLAKEAKLPVVIHSRDAAKDTIDLLQEAHAEQIGGVIHCYSYSKELVPTFLDMGFYFGIGGVLTFKNGRKLREAVEVIPMDRIVLETDSPYLAPEPNRGKRNCSLNIPYVIQALSQIKGLPPEEIEQLTWDNACRMYGMR